MILGLALPVAAMLLLMPVAGQAADLGPRGPIYKGVPAPTYMAFDWSGFYIGINGGYGFGKSHHNFDAVGTTTGDYNVTGALAGGTVGYNWQMGSYVFGGEADFDWSNIKGSAPCPNPAFTCGTENNWLGTARGRLGYAFNRWLPYFTGGAAFGSVKATISPSAGFPGATSTRIGWVVGGGLEYAAWNYWSVKLEYNYVDLGSFNCGAGCTGTGVDNVSFNTHIVRAGINYRF